MGPWSILAAGWLPLPAVFGQLSPSLVFDTGTDIPAEALFLEYQEETGAVVAVEVFPRADGSTLVTALFRAIRRCPWTRPPWRRTRTRSSAWRRSAHGCRLLSPRRGSSPGRPASVRSTQDGLPLIGKVPRMENAYVATGHSVWGILNAPATGEAMAELIADGVARSVDLTPFDPIRLRPLDPARLRTTNPSPRT